MAEEPGKGSKRHSRLRERHVCPAKKRKQSGKLIFNKVVAVAFHEADASFNIPLAFVLIAVGNMVPVPFIFFFARRFLEWGRDKKVIGRFFTWCLEKGHKGGEKLQKSAGKGLYWALLIFVGIPLPGTGAVFSPLSAVWRLPASSWRFCPSAWQRACTWHKFAW